MPSHPTVVSLLPSATEIVCAVGGEEQLVGVSHECDWPPSVVGRPVLTRAKLDMAGRSGAIDRDLRALVRDALAVYDLVPEALAAAAPDVIVTQDLCAVCAVSLRQVEGAVRDLLRRDTRVVNLSPLRLDDVRGDVLAVGEAIGRGERAREVLAGLDARFAEIAARARAAVAAAGRRPRVLTIEWIDPVMVGGTWMPELVELAGGEALVTRPGDHAPTLTRAQLAALDPAPDVVVVKPCGFRIALTVRESDALDALLGAMPWPAIGNGQTWIADGNAYFNRPGPRLVESAEILAAILHPVAFPDFVERHAETGYRRFGVRRG